MENKKKDNLFEEHLRKIKHRVNYTINESPKYRPAMGEVYDEMPLTNEAGEPETGEPEGDIPPAPKTPPPAGNDPMAGGTPPTPPAPAGAPTGAPEPPVPAFDKTGGDPMAGGAPAPEDPAMGGAPVTPNPEQQVDTLQNDIIKHNIEAMKSIHDQLQALEDSVKGLNSQLAGLNAEVEEVREPTNSEKLMSKKNVSYPFYFNLNDFWSGNWFSEQRAKENEKGINELPDGTYIADFDDLPQKSKIDVQNSFNDIV